MDNEQGAVSFADDEITLLAAECWAVIDIFWPIMGWIGVF